MCKQIKNPVRKRPCPYCGKKLQAKSKHRWRNNLARHLANTCQPYQREHIGMMTKMIGEVIQWAITGQLPRREDPAAKAKDVAELQRLFEKE